MSLDALFKGWVGELKTDITQKLLLDSKKYHVFNNVIIPTTGNTTQIDHIVVSPYGVFVVETKQRSGWIFGTEREANWTQQHYNSKVSFQNPLRQNYLHTQSLSEFLQIDNSKLHSLVVLWGGCTFKTQKPANVLTNWLEYSTYMRSKKEVLFSDDEVNIICSKLKEKKETTTFFASIQHAKSVKDRYSSSVVCPKCGGKLIERTRKTTGTKFLGCDNYPNCVYQGFKVNLKLLSDFF